MTAPIEHVLIVGAGIAGCSAAIAFARRGVAVTIVEREVAWRFQSSGIFVYGNGLAAFDRLGLLAPIVDAGFVIDRGRNVYLEHDGTPIVDTFYPSPTSSTHAGRIPAILGIKRAEMHRVLAAELGRLGIAVRLGTTLADAVMDTDAVVATLSDGTTVRVDLLIGADGIRSTVRERWWPAVKPAYSGFGVWRSVHRRPAALVDKVTMMAEGKRLGIMPIATDRLYVFGTVADPRNAWHDRAQWPALMRAQFAEFGGPVRPFLDELAAPDVDCDVLYTAVEEIRMPAPWHRDRVLLIGDAAHAATPFMGQGGAMAVEDAVTLAAMLDGARDVDATLARFGERRAAMCRFVQDVSRRVGESGAEKGAAVHRQKLALLRETGQRQVDDFYGELERLAAQ